ncbi:hypothetical protein ACET3Z_004661 [Daucus carota]
MYSTILIKVANGFDSTNIGKCAGRSSTYHIKYLPQRDYDGPGLPFFVKAAASGIISRSKGKAPVAIIVIVVLVVVTVVLSLFLLLLYKKKRLRRKGNMTLSSLHGDAADQSQREDFELPLFEFARIAKATNNFSNNNKLGEGGFGPVYMGILEEGQEIAVKRLSKTSKQGLDEFKNEVLCIDQVA